MFEPPELFVHLLPDLIAPGVLRGGVAVVVDVLRATTVMAHALASGCEAVVPCLEIEDAFRAAAGLPPGTALLGGERGGLPIEGFDLGNSPSSFTPEVCRGKTLVMTTTNGTRAILASMEAERVYVASFANLGATVAEISVQGLKVGHARPIHVVCSGTGGQISLEDCLFAGALASRLVDRRIERLPAPLAPKSDELHLVLAQWREADRSMGEGGRLAEILSRGRGGRNVRRIGLESDIEDAARIDRFDLVAELDRQTMRILDISKEDRDASGASRT